MPSQKSKKKKIPSYIKITLNRQKLLFSLAPFFIGALTLGIIFLGKNLIQNQPKISPQNLPFGLTEIFYPWIYPDSSPESTNSANHESTESAEPDTYEDLPELNEPPPNFMESDKTTPELFVELDEKINRLEELDCPTELIKKLNQEAQELFNKGQNQKAREKLLWTIQLAKELISLKTGQSLE